jgi:antibiotic biosynthesis monooxygenase (ABM) superfamily enzyme
VPYQKFLALLARLFVTTVMYVTLMRYVLNPLVTRLLPPWLSPGPPFQNGQGAIHWWRDHQGVGSHDSKRGAKP